MTASIRPAVAVMVGEGALRQALVAFLAGHGFDARGVSGESALAEALLSRPVDLILLDVHRPEDNGFDVVRKLRRKFDAGIVVLSSLESNASRIRALDAGAEAYLPRDAAGTIVVATVKAVLRRLVPTFEEGVAEPIWVLNPLAWTLTAPNGRSFKLTGHEKTFLSPLFETPGRPVERAELIRHLGKRDCESSRRNLDAASRRLRQKVEARLGEALPLITVYGFGYVFDGEASLAN